MVAKNSPDVLPAGWSVESKQKNGRKVEYYTNSETGQKFYSKNDFLRYIKVASIHFNTPQSIDTQVSPHSGKEHMQVVMKENELPEWLPKGWTVELKAYTKGSKIGKEHKYYVDPLTGRKFQSRPEVFRYLKSAKRNSCSTKQKKQCLGVQSSENVIVKENEDSELLPKGWIVEKKTRKSGSKYKCYVDPSTGRKFLSKPEVFRYLKSVEGDSYSSKQKEVVVAMHSTENNHADHTTESGHSSEPDMKHNIPSSKKKKKSKSARNVVVEKVSPEGLPPGWTLEIKTKKQPYGKKRRDPYYTDPVTGYVFRSRLDVFRYLDTGEISRHAFKPKNWSINNSAIITNEISASPTSAAKRQELTDRATKRQLFAGKESSEVSSSADLEGTSIRRSARVSAKTTLVSAPTNENLQKKNSLVKANDKCAESNENSDPSSAALPEVKNSKRKRGEKIDAENKLVSTPSTDILPEKNLQEKKTEKCAEAEENPDPSTSTLPTAKGSNGKKGNKGSAVSGSVTLPTANVCEEENLPKQGVVKRSPTNSQKSSNVKNQNELNLPRRSSKRLAGLVPLQAVDFKSSEQALQVAASEDMPDLNLVVNSVAHEASKQLEVNPEFACDTAVGPETSLVEDPSKKSEKPLEDQISPKKEMEILGTKKEDDKNTESQPIFPFTDSWSDPCLEFAFKTLTGAIPLEDNLDVGGYLQQHADTGLGVPEFPIPNISQSDGSSHSNTPVILVSEQQLQINPPFLPSSNVSLPSCNVIGPQQPSLEGNNSNNSKVH